MVGSLRCWPPPSFFTQERLVMMLSEIQTELDAWKAVQTDDMRMESTLAVFGMSEQLGMLLLETYNPKPGPSAIGVLGLYVLYFMKKENILIKSHMVHSIYHTLSNDPICGITVHIGKLAALQRRSFQSVLSLRKVRTKRLHHVTHILAYLTALAEEEGLSFPLLLHETWSSIKATQ